MSTIPPSGKTDRSVGRFFSGEHTAAAKDAAETSPEDAVAESSFGM